MLDPGVPLVVAFVPGNLRQLPLLQVHPPQLLTQVVPFALGDSSVAAPEAVRDLAREVAEVPLQVGACLQQHWQEWEKIGAGEWVVKTLRYGYVLPFLRDPPLSGSPVEFPSYMAGSERHLA